MQTQVATNLIFRCFYLACVHILHIYASHLVDQNRVSNEQGVFLLFLFLSLAVQQVSKSQTHTQHHAYTQKITVNVRCGTASLQEIHHKIKAARMNLLLIPGPNTKRQNEQTI